MTQPNLEERVEQARADLDRFRDHAVRLHLLLERSVEAMANPDHPMHETAPLITPIVVGHIQGWAKVLDRQEGEIADLERLLAASE